MANSTGSVGTISINMRANTDKLPQDFNHVKTELDKLDNSVSKKGSGMFDFLGKGISSLGGAGAIATGGLTVVAGAITAVATAAVGAGVALATLAIKGIDEIDTLGDTAAAISDTVANLQSLQYVAKLSGDEIEGLDGVIAKMTLNLGKGDAADALQKIGLSAKELKNESPIEAFFKISDALSKIENPADRAALAMEIFGKGYTNVANTIASGRVAELRQEFERLGLTLTETDVAAAGKAQDNFDKLGMIFHAITLQVGAKLAPAFVSATNTTLAWAEKNIVASELVSSGVNLLVESVAFIGDAWDTATLGFNTFYMIAFRGLYALTELTGLVVQGFELMFGMEGNLGQAILDKAAQFKMVSEELAKDVAKQGWNNITGQGTGDTLRKEFANLKNEWNNLAEDTKSNQPDFAAIQEAQEQAKKLADEVSSMEEKYRQAIKTFGMSSRQAEIALLEERLLPAEAEQLKRLDAELTRLEEEKKLRDEAAKVREEVMSKEEKFAERMNKLDELHQAGLITDMELEKAKAKAQEDLMGKAQERKNPFADLVDFGSQKAREIILRNSFQLGAGDESGRITARATTQSVDELRAIRRAVEKQEEVFSIN